MMDFIRAISDTVFTTGLHETLYNHGDAPRSCSLVQGVFDMSAPGTNIEIIINGSVTTASGALRQIFNVFHAQSNGAPTASAAQVLAGFLVFWNAQIAPRLSAGYIGVGSSCRFMDDSTLLPVAGAAPANGSQALPRVDSALAAVLYMKTALRGKRFRGNKHFSPLAAAAVGNDELVAGEVTAWNAVGVAMLGGFSSVGVVVPYLFTIFSRTNSPSLVNPTNLTNTLITSVRTNKTLGTMRRRKEKTAF